MGGKFSKRSVNYMRRYGKDVAQNIPSVLSLEYYFDVDFEEIIEVILSEGETPDATEQPQDGATAETAERPEYNLDESLTKVPVTIMWNKAKLPGDNRLTVVRGEGGGNKYTLSIEPDPEDRTPTETTWLDISLPAGLSEAPQAARHSEHPVLPVHWDGARGGAAVDVGGGRLRCTFQHSYRILLPGKPSAPWSGRFACHVKHNEVLLPGTYQLVLDNVATVVLVGEITIARPGDPESRKLKLDFSVPNVFLAV